MQINRDFYNNLEVPDFVLCKANRERIGVIFCTDKITNLNFNDLDNIEFTTYYMIDGEKNPIYDSIEVMKYIYVQEVGFYYIKTCNIQSEGSEHEYKEVTAESYEGLLGQKYIENFKINTGDIESKELDYDDSGSTPIYIWLSPQEKLSTGKKDLFDYVLEKCPDWYVSYVDPILLEEGRSHRSFDIDRKDVYSFIMEDVQDAFECYVEFDTLHLDNKGRCPISIYAQENYKYDTNIYVSYDNLLKSTNISSSTDDIKTCVVLEGEDELEIREINLGYDRIYNFDYYNNTDFWSQKLYDEYNEWHEKTYNVGRILYQKLKSTDEYNPNLEYYVYSDGSYTQDTTVTSENFASKVTEGLYIKQRNSNVYTEDITDDQLRNMSYLDLYKYRLKKYLEAKTELDDLYVLTSKYVNDEDRGIGSGEFPVFNDAGEEVGSIKFEADIGVRVTENLPSQPFVGEENYIYIVKDTNIDITALKNQLAILQSGQNYTTTTHSPIATVNKSNIYKLQNKFYETVSNSRKSMIRSLRELEADGSVDLLLRPVIDSSKLELAGWEDVGDGIATIFSSTYSNEQENIVMNFTPIRADEFGNLISILSPDQLQEYAEEVIWNYEHNLYREKINGVWVEKHVLRDPLKLKVGKTFKNINNAVREAETIHNIHEQYFGTGAYWEYFNKDVVYDDNVKIINVDDFLNTIRNEMQDISNYIGTFIEQSYYNEINQIQEYTLDYRNYNDGKKRLKLLEKLYNSLVVWIPIADTYSIPKTIGDNLVNVDDSFNKLLTQNNTNYIINDLAQYKNSLDTNISSKKQQLEIAKTTASVTYPGYKIYRWFDNTNTRTFYNALVSANNSYETTKTISVADATTLRDYNPLYNTCLIIGSNVVDISRPEDFEEYLEEDLTEQTALITIFPTSTWFNTNDWRGYGYSELTDTWASTVDQELTVLKKDNKGNVPNAYKDAEIDSADHSWKADSTPDEKSAWYYFGEYLPCYLTQLAIEAQIATLDAQIDGYETYPYALTSKGNSLFSELPTSGNTQGDTYTITNDFVLDNTTYSKGTNVTWDGTKWIITSDVATHIDGIQDKINKQGEYKAQVVNEIQLDNNLTEPSRMELSAFIREEELNSDNFVVTDIMTEEERQEMLESFLEYGNKELSKICIPQLSFSASISNLYSIPEFDVVSTDFEPGKTIYISLRDDYHIKATLLSVHVNYYDPSDFTMTFSDILKRNKGLYTDIQDAINTATSAATSVAIGSSSWSEAATTATKINTSLQEGLLSQGNYLSDNPAKSTFVIDDTGIFVDTASGDYGKYDVFGEEKYVYDSIYIGGGRILFTDDGWKHVRMSLGRSKVTRVVPGNPFGTTSEEFGVFADFVISGYVAGSQICGGELYSSAFAGNNPVSYFNLDNGTFTIRSKSTGRPVMSFNGNTLSLGGYATETDIQDERNSREQSESALQQGINQVSYNLTQEVSDRENADSTLNDGITNVSDNLDTEISNRENGDIALGQGIDTVSNNLDKEITDRMNVDNTLSAAIDAESEARIASYNEMDARFADYTTEVAFEQWATDAGFTSLEDVITLKADHVKTGFLSAYNNKSWINMDTGAFNFGGGKLRIPGIPGSDVNYGDVDDESTNYIAWNPNDGTLFVKGDIYANNGVFNGTVYAEDGEIGGFTIADSNLSSTGVYLGTDGLKIGCDYYPSQYIYNGFTVTSDGLIFGGKAKFCQWTINDLCIAWTPNISMPDQVIGLYCGFNPYLRIGNHIMRPDTSSMGTNTFQINITGNADSANYANSAGTANSASSYTGDSLSTTTISTTNLYWIDSENNKKNLSNYKTIQKSFKDGNGNTVTIRYIGTQ